MIWILTICTAGWVMCGQQSKIEYQTEMQCYRAMEEIYKRQPSSDFKFITCAPKTIKEE
jgi:hypothetical protein